LQIVSHPLLVARPFLELLLEVEDQRGAQVSVAPNEQVRAILTWENTSVHELYDVEIQANLPDPYIIESSVSPQEGYYNSRDDVILWTPQTNEAFTTVPVGAKGSLVFSFRVQDPGESPNVENPNIPLTFTVRARRLVNDRAVSQVLYNQEPTTIQFETTPSLQTYALYRSGPFANSGPVPPRAEQETSYTIAFEVRNTTSDVDNVALSSQLPVNVTWLGAYSPSSERVEYNPITRRFMWDVGDVPAHTGTRQPARVLYVQVRVLPSVTDVGDDLLLTHDITFTGVDRYTKRPLRIVYDELHARLDNDIVRVQNSQEVVE
jgi:hypothetical protein